jgi:hypothetical protein
MLPVVSVVNLSLSDISMICTSWYISHGMIIVCYVSRNMWRLVCFTLCFLPSKQMVLVIFQLEQVSCYKLCNIRNRAEEVPYLFPSTRQMLTWVCRLLVLSSYLFAISLLAQLFIFCWEHGRRLPSVLYSLLHST